MLYHRIYNNYYLNSLYVYDLIQFRFTYENDSLYIDLNMNHLQINQWVWINSLFELFMYKMINLLRIHITSYVIVYHIILHLLIMIFAYLIYVVLIYHPYYQLVYEHIFFMKDISFYYHALNVVSYIVNNFI